jgi:hypothetical protein
MQARTSPRRRLRWWDPSRCLRGAFGRISRGGDILMFRLTA